jgi:hypothetical protein
MDERLRTPRWILPRVGSIALVALLWWWWPRPPLTGMWTGVVPQSLCGTGMQALRFEGNHEWHVQAYDYGCGGTYRIVTTIPPMVTFDVRPSQMVTFTYTLTADRLVLQSTTPYAIYTLVPCPRWESCTGLGP